MERFSQNKMIKNKYQNSSVKNRGFTLIEVIISLVLFSVIFGAVMSMYLLFNKILVGNYAGSGCSDFSRVIIQNLLTTSDFFEVATTSNEVDFKYTNNPIYQILKSDSSILYVLSSSDLADFGSSTQIGSCGSRGISFAKNQNMWNGGMIMGQSASSTNQFKSSFLNYYKCLDLQYSNPTSTETICGMY